MTTAATTPASWRRAADTLFVAAPGPASPEGRGRWPLAVAGTAAVLAGTLVGLLRHPGWLALDTVYAEDGTVFLADAAAGSPLEPLVTAYAGYHHLVPRLLAALAGLVPAGAAAAVLAVSAAAVTAALAVLVYAASGGHLASPLARALVAAGVVAVPLAQQEVPNSVANLHWPALYAVFWLLVWTPAGRTGRVVAPAVVALTAASDILVVVFLPLAAARLLARRDGYSAVLAGLLVLGVAGQLTGLGSGGRDVSFDPVQPVTGYLLRAVPAALLGERWLPEAGTDPRRLALAALAWLLVAAVVIIAARRVSQPRWTLALTAAWYGVVLYALPVVLTGIAPSRYAVAPGLLLVAALVALLHPDPSAPRRPGSRPAAPLVALAVLLAAVWVINLRVDTERELGPRWRAELDQARAECATAAPDTVVEVPVTPPGEGWDAALPCRYLTDRS